MGQEEAEGLNLANKHINDIKDRLPDEPSKNTAFPGSTVIAAL